MKVKSESEVAQSCLTLSDPMDCSPPDSSIHGIFQARVLESGAIAFSALKPCPPLKNIFGDFSGSSVIKTHASNPVGADLISGWGTKIPMY